MGRVALESILFTSNFWRAKRWQKFGKFQILVVVALDQHVLAKTSLIDIHVTRSSGNKTVSRVYCAIDFCQECNSLQIFLFAACSSLSDLQQRANFGL